MTIRSIFPRPPRPAGRDPLAMLLAAAALAGGCASSPTLTVAEDQETFDSAATYSRSYPAASSAQACEAARRALLSQGYLIASSTVDQVQGRKHFQPKGDVHVELELRIVCAPGGDGRPGAIAFVNALQDRYALKKSSISASLGVAAFGSLSLPLASSEDSLVRVASRTVTAASFYERFFTLVERYLPDEPPPAGPAAAASSPAPAVGESAGDDEAPAAASRTSATGTRVAPASRSMARHATIWLSSPVPARPAG